MPWEGVQDPVGTGGRNASQRACVVVLILLPPTSVTLCKSLNSYGFSWLIYKAGDLNNMVLMFLLALRVLVALCHLNQNLCRFKLGGSSYSTCTNMGNTMWLQWFLDSHLSCEILFEVILERDDSGICSIIYYPQMTIPSLYFGPGLCSYHQGLTSYL